MLLIDFELIKTNVTNGSMNSINRLQLWNKWIIVKSEFNFHYHHNWIKWNELDIQNMLDDKICWISWQNRLDMKLTKLTKLKLEGKLWTKSLLELNLNLI